MSEEFEKKRLELFLQIKQKALYALIAMLSVGFLYIWLMLLAEIGLLSFLFDLLCYGTFIYGLYYLTHKSPLYQELSFFRNKTVFILLCLIVGIIIGFKCLSRASNKMMGEKIEQNLDKKYGLNEENVFLGDNASEIELEKQFKDECLKDPACIAAMQLEKEFFGNHLIKGYNLCRKAVELVAPWDIEWQSKSIKEGIQSIAKKDIDSIKGEIYMEGLDIKMKDQNGDWYPAWYSCVYDIEKKKIYPSIKLISPNKSKRSR